MNFPIILFSCILKCVISEIPSPLNYYGENFLDFTVKMTPKNILLETIFDHLDSIKNSSGLCYSHLVTYRSSLRNNSIWAMNYLDSSGYSPGPGWLTGNIVNLGAFDECVSPKIDVGFRGKYCWLSIQLYEEKQLSLKNPIVFSLCVPDSCGPKDVSIVITPLAKQLNFSTAPFCQTARPSMTTVDYISVCFFAIIGLFTLSSLMPKEWIPTRDTPFQNFRRCFDLYRNTSALISRNKSENILTCLYAIRFLSQCCVIWIHTAYNDMTYINPIQNKFIFHDQYRSWLGAFKTQLCLVVDTFFMVGGTVITYNCLKKKTQLNLLKYYFQRYLRLTPTLIAVIIFAATFCNKLCSGPSCSNLSDNERANCGKYWWANMLYINNFYPKGHFKCLFHTWYLACDWQLFIFVSPIIVTVINRKPQVIYKLIALIFLSSLIYSAITSVLFDIPVESILFDNLDLSGSISYLHNSFPLVRAGPWAIGVFLGVFLNNYNRKPKVLSKSTIYLGWTVCAILLVFCSSFSLLPFVLENSHSSVWARTAFLTLNRNLFVLAVAWIVFACSAKIAGPIGKILTAPVFEPLGKLTYAIYLIHYPIIFLYYGSFRTPSYFSSVLQIPIILGLIVISSFAGLILHLTIEAPFMHIQKLLFFLMGILSTSILRHIPKIFNKHKLISFIHFYLLSLCFYII